MAVIAIVYALGHQLKISGGSLGASFSKWGMRRVTIGPKTHRRSRALPSNGALVVSIVVVAVAIVLCLIGNDYINPSAGVFQFSVARRWDLSSIPQYTITKSLWTMANRFGYMSFAVLPLVILLAAKSRPIALLSFKYFTAVQYDKLLTFHQLAGWLVWGLTTAHVALWTVQLFKDSYNGKAMWFHAFTAYRFIVGCVAYGILTLLMVSTLRPVRRYRFEVRLRQHVLTLRPFTCLMLHSPSFSSLQVLSTTLRSGGGSLQLLEFGPSTESPGLSDTHVSTAEQAKLQEQGATSLQEQRTSRSRNSPTRCYPMSHTIHLPGLRLD